MSDNIFEQLKKMRNEPAAGYVNEERRSEARESLMSAITTEEEKNWAPSAMVEFAWVSFSDFLARPTAALASFTILILGSLTTVSAASQSLPGDTLYGIKLVAERAELTLSSADRRAVLHTEFAGRRLQEISELSTVGGKDQLVASAVTAFKKEVESAALEIKNLPSNATDKMIAQVSEVTERFEQLQESANTTKEVETISEEVIETTESASEKVVDVVVENHETAPKPASDRELKEIFQTRYAKLIEQRALSLGRIEVIREHPKYGEAQVVSDIREINNELDELRATIGDASQLALAGGYRAAFEDIREAEALIKSVMSQLSTIEAKLIELSQPPVEEVSQPTEEAEEASIDEENN